MSNACSSLEYIWIDGFNNLRSKSKINRHPYQQDPKDVTNIPEWNFDGSSTGQAEGFKSDVILCPVASFDNPFIFDPPYFPYAYKKLVLCETKNADGTPHVTNNRHACKLIHDATQSQEPWFGIEQEYIIYDAKTNLPYGWIGEDLPSALHKEQGPFYCSAGGDVAFGRKIAEEHLAHCMKAGLKICGINAEVTPSQWEFQIGPLSAIDVSDQLWVARYILNRIAEKYGCYIVYHPKPMSKWNGSGCHTNFSTKLMRQTPTTKAETISNEYIKLKEKTSLSQLNPSSVIKCDPGEIIKFIKDKLKDCNPYEEFGGIYEIENACKKLSVVHSEHIAVYGNIEQNKLRLTGHHETASIDKFTWGVSDRSASIRIPLNVSKDRCGYLEDRRPASNMDPYLVTARLLQTICLADNSGNSDSKIAFDIKNYQVFC
jgi:glutamine synthetase